MSSFLCCFLNGNDTKEDTAATNEVPTAPTTTSDKPKPMVFALMRNGHEVIRGGQRDLKSALFDKQDLDLAKSIYEKNKIWQDLHLRMEEGVKGTGGSSEAQQEHQPMGVFQLLDNHFDGAASDAELLQEHHKIEKYEEDLEIAFQSGDLNQMKVAFTAFDEANLEHLKKEEGIMMPLIKKLSNSGHPMKKYMNEEVLATIIDDPKFEFWIRYANDVLERHPEDMPRVRVFDHALYALATDKQWPVWEEWIKDSLSEETFQELQDAIGGV